MSAQHSKPSIRSALERIVFSSASVAMEKVEQCDGCRRMFSLRQVELIEKQILCSDCAPAEFTAPLHPHLPAHPRLRSARTGPRP